MSTVFCLAMALLAYAWRASRKASLLNMRLVRTEETNQLLNEMNMAASGLAHETRNPLNVIRGLAQNIKTCPGTNPDVLENADLLIHEADAITGRLNEFMNYSKPCDPQLVPVGLEALINDVCRVLKVDMDEKHISTTVDESPIVVEADRLLLRQIVFNLLLNACQAVKSDGDIHCGIAANDGHCSFVIDDNGPGVPEGERDNIFKPYYCLRQDGTGLGLTIVKRIATAHGWDVHCDVSPLGGARIQVDNLRICSETTDE